MSLRSPIAPTTTGFARRQMRALSFLLFSLSKQTFRGGWKQSKRQVLHPVRVQANRVRVQASRGRLVLVAAHTQKMSLIRGTLPNCHLSGTQHSAFTEAILSSGTLLAPIRFTCATRYSATSRISTPALSGASRLILIVRIPMHKAHSRRYAISDLRTP